MDRDTPAPDFLTTREVAALLRVRERRSAGARRVVPSSLVAGFLHGAIATGLG